MRNTFRHLQTLRANPAQQRRLRAELLGLWQLAWPILVGQLAVIGMAVVDVAMAGHASAADLAGVALGVSIWNMLSISLMGLMMSVNPMVAHAVGAGQLDWVPAIVRQGLWKALALGLAGTLLANLCVPLFDTLGLEPQVHHVAQRFVHISSLCLPLFAMYRVLHGYSTSLNQTKPLMVIALLALSLNALVNWVLVFGRLGFAPQGGAGCAWALLITLSFSVLALLGWMRHSPAYRSTWPFAHWEGPNAPLLRELLHLGWPIGLTYFAETSAFSLIALLVAPLGSTEIAAHQIALNFTSLVFMVPLSLGLALLTRIGQSMGAQDPVRARFQAWTGVALALTLATVSAGLMALCAQPIARLYTRDPAVVALTSSLLLLAALFQLSDATQVVTSCAIRGYKVTRPPMLIHMTAFWLFALPLGYALGLGATGLAWLPTQPMGARGFWIALVVGLTVAAVGLSLLLRRVAQLHLPR
ncbi:MAG: proton-coupled multidrug efflux MATE transporter PmpM [Rhodoferax sp.]